MVPECVPLLGGIDFIDSIFDILLTNAHIFSDNK